MEALEKPREKRVKAGVKSKAAMVEPAATHQHVRLRIKLPVSPARAAPAAVAKGAKPSTGVSVITSNHDPAVSDLSDHKSSETEPASPLPEHPNFSNTTLKELRRRYEAKFGTATLSNNSDYLKRKLAGQCGPPRLRRANAEHELTVERSPKTSPTFRRRKDVLEPDLREVESEEELDLELEEADGEESDPEAGMQDGEALTPLKKQRSGRKDGGANQWTNQAEEIRRIVRKKRRNRAFPPQTLVWAKLEGRPWWPARVVILDDVPEAVLAKRLVGWTCVELYGLPPTDEQHFAWLKRENLVSYRKFRKDFNEQKFPERSEDGRFQLALKEISEEAKRRRTVETPGGTKFFGEGRESSMELRSSSASSSDDDVAEAVLRKELIDTGKKHLKHRAEIVQGKLKQIRMKNVHSEARPVWPTKADGEQISPKVKKARDNGGDVNRKRKRLVDEQSSQGTSDEAEDAALPDSPPKKAVSDSKFNRQSFGKKLNRSLSNAGDSVKVDKEGPRKPKRTGEDGYYYDCEVCGIGGELLCCDLCPRVYHLECLTPPLKRTPPGKWVCPTCRDRSGVTRTAGSSLGDARQQSKVKNVDDPSRAGHKIWRKEKPIGAQVILSDKLAKRRREDSDSTSRRKRSKSKGEEEGQRRLNCGYCGIETSSLRSSGLCDKCHSEIRAGAADEHPSSSAPPECVEATHHEKEKQKSGRCHMCGERGVVISCEGCSCAFHKDCVVPALRKTPKCPWYCSNCSSLGDHQLEEDGQLLDTFSVEVHRILGCRHVGGQDPPTSRNVTETEKDKEPGGDSSEVENIATGSVMNVLERPGDADMEWKVVKRKQSPDTGELETAEPMEIDPLSSAVKSSDSEDEPETKVIVSESESPLPQSITKEKSAPKSSSNGAIQVVEDPSFVIEIGGHDMNLNVRLPLDGAAKTDGNAPNKETAREGLLDSVIRRAEDVTKEAKNGGDRAAESPEKKGDNYKPPRLEFLVKWRDRAHIHNEWVSEERLQVIAKRKLEKYKAKYGTGPSLIMDDRWLEPQRVLARRVGKSGVAEVLVKWHGQPYDECTWEEENQPVITKNLELVRSFERFEVSKKETTVSRPVELEELTEQPEWLRGGGLLFPHQLDALNWLRKSWHQRNHVILADEMGLGKTISACAFLSSLYREFRVSAPSLVLVPLATLPNWLSEFSLWAPFLNVIEYYGSPKARALIREHEWYAVGDIQAIKFNVMLASYEAVIADSSELRLLPWEVVMVDGPRDSESKLFPLLSTYESSLRVLLTDTAPASNVHEMNHLLNFLEPEAFPSRDEKFGSADELRRLLAPHMLRRLKKDAMETIPQTAERVVPVELTRVQAEHCRAALTRNYELLRHGSGGRNQSLLNIMMRLRMLSNHPYLLPGLEPKGETPKSRHEMRIKASAKLTFLHSMLHHLKKGGHRVLIVSQMKKLLDILEEYLSFEFGDQSFERVDESVPMAERQQAVSRFNQDPSRMVFLLSTRACGLGINLPSADMVVIHDSDLNPHADIQALNRAHQIGQSKTLLVYRLMVRASVEERLLQLARKKVMVEYLSANKPGPQKGIYDIIRWGAEELFAEELSVLLNAENGAAEEAPIDKKSEDPSQTSSQRKVKAGKVVWDDAAVSRLLDRSELATTNLEVAEGDHEDDWLGTLKTWTWSEPDGVEQVGSDEGAAKDVEAAESPLNSIAKEQDKWEELLRARWEKLQKEEEARRGPEERPRKEILYDESLVLKSEEDSPDHSEEELDGDCSSEPRKKPTPRVEQVLGKARADERGDDNQFSLAHEERPGRGSFKAPASTSSNPLSQHRHPEWRPNSPGVHSNGATKSSAPITIDLEDAPRASPAINIINVEQSRNGNVSYPHRVYTVPGTPVGPVGEHAVASSKHSLLPREQVDPDLSILRKQFDRSSQSGSIRHLLPPAIPGSSRPYGSVGHSAIRPVLFDNEDRLFCPHGNRRPEPDLQGLQPDLLQRAYAQESQNSAMLSTSDVPHASSIPDARDSAGSMNMSEILRRVTNKKAGVLLPPDGRSSSHLLSSDVLPTGLAPSPNLSMSLGLGGLHLSSQDQALLARALASRESQNLASSHHKTVGEASSSGGSGEATRVHVPDILLAPGAGHEAKPLDGASRLLSSSQDMAGLQSMRKHEVGRVSPPLRESDARFKHIEPWTEDELDSLWTGVRRLGCGNWLAMLSDRRLIFHKSRTALDLAERWREEQARLFGAPTAEPDSKPAKQGYCPLSSGEDQRYNEEKKRKESAEGFLPKDAVDLTISQGLGTNFGEFDRKQVLESLRAVDLSYRRSSGLTGNPAIDKVEYSKVPEPSSALDLSNTIKSHGSGSRSSLEIQSIEFDKWEGTSSRRRADAAREILRQSQLQKTKLPASFLANLAFNQPAEKHSQELRDQHTLPLLPQAPAPSLGLLGQSSSGAFPPKAPFGQHDSFFPRGFHDSPRGHHDARAASLSSTFAEMEKRRLKAGLGSSRNSDSSDANPSLPHWLREAFKPDQPPPPKPATVSPMITAVSQATSFLYKDCVPFLPPFVHPGPLPAPPRRAAKKRRRESDLGRGTELNFLISGAESANPSLSSSLQQFASSLNVGFQPGSAPSSFSKRLVDFSALPTLDPPAQPSFPRPSPALEDLISFRNLPPLAPHEPGLVLDSKERHRDSTSLRDSRKGDREAAAHPRRRTESRKAPAFPFASNSPSPESPHRGSGESKLPSWMLAAEVGAKSRHKASTKAKHEEANSSSETESDPRVRGAAGMTGDDDSDASSDETVSDDRTQ